MKQKNSASYKGKKQNWKPWQWLMVIGLTMGFLLFILSPFIRSMGFLVQLTACFFMFLAWWGFLIAPWQGRCIKFAARILKIITLVLVVAVLLSFVWIEAILIGYGRGEPQDHAAAIIVLGAGLYGETPSLVLASRLNLAYEYLLANPDTIAIVSGGQGPGETITEALAMERYLVTKGIAQERIWQEDDSYSTFENISNSKEILKEIGLPLDSVVIISNDFHLYRAQLLAQDMGITATTWGAPVPKIWLTPLNSYVREYFSIVKMFLWNLVG